MWRRKERKLGPCAVVTLFVCRRMSRRSRCFRFCAVLSCVVSAAVSVFLSSRPSARPRQDDATRMLYSTGRWLLDHDRQLSAIYQTFPAQQSSQPCHPFLLKSHGHPTPCRSSRRPHRHRLLPQHQSSSKMPKS